MGRLRPRKNETPDTIRAGLAVLREAIAKHPEDSCAVTAFRLAIERRERELDELLKQRG